MYTNKHLPGSSPTHPPLVDKVDHEHPSVSGTELHGAVATLVLEVHVGTLLCQETRCHQVVRNRAPLLAAKQLVANLQGARKAHKRGGDWDTINGLPPCIVIPCVLENG